MLLRNVFAYGGNARSICTQSTRGRKVIDIFESCNFATEYRTTDFKGSMQRRDFDLQNRSGFSHDSSRKDSEKFSRICKIFQRESLFAFLPSK